MKRIVYIFALLSLVAITFEACKKNKKEVDNETQTVTDNALCEQEFMRIGPAVSERAVSTAGVKKLLPGYMTVYSTCASDTLTGDTTNVNGTFTDSTNLPTLTLDWGAGCTDVDGVFRSGKLVTSFTKKHGIIGSVITVTPTNYKAGNITYSGTIKITRIDTGKYSAFRVQVIGGKCQTNDWSIDFATDKTITYKQGYNTPSDPTDDIISITGNSNGKNREGRTFTVNITSALIKKADCKWIQSGILEITPDGLKTRTVDFGAGTCDNTGTFSVNGNTFTFTMQ